MAVTSGLGVEQRDDGWTVAGHTGDPEDLRLCNDYLGYLADRNYGAGTRRGIVKLFENTCGAVDVSGLGCVTY